MSYAGQGIYKSAQTKTHGKTKHLILERKHDEGAFVLRQLEKTQSREKAPFDEDFVIRAYEKWTMDSDEISIGMEFPATENTQKSTPTEYDLKSDPSEYSTNVKGKGVEAIVRSTDI